ncbi:MAG TPA: SCO family protein, partial [Bryobacteraceae bacterium]|nr:SCO family protein [Bryobacteraceae bacterium]
MAGFVRIFFIFISLIGGLAARSYSVDGLVLSVNPPSFAVAHRPIPGYMPAMTMEFRAAADKDLAPIRPGMRVRFDWRDNIARAIRVVPADEADMPAPAVVPRVGETAPNFRLTDHRGEDLALSDLRGKLVALNFIYTRCPMSEVCPRLAASFATVQRRFRSSLGRDLVLLSITIDPQWDTPQVLDAYAKLWRAYGEGWRFLTGPPETVEKTAASWGLVFWPEDGAIVHTSRTALIGRDGKLVAMVEGPSYRTDQLVELIRHH